MEDQDMKDMVVDENSPIQANTELQGMEGVEQQKGQGGVAKEGGETKKADTDNPLKGEFTWRIEGFSKLGSREESERFEIGGYSWYLLLFPRGNTAPQNVAVYLAMAETKEEAEISERYASFNLILVDQHDANKSVAKDANHKFTPQANDWGFGTLVTVEDLLDPSRGLCVDDVVILKVIVHVNTQDDIFYDSRAETGFVGLKNQGATCYMNSLLQTLYNINQFRKAVYRLPTSEDEVPSQHMPLALQSVFHMLQFTQGPVSTKDLTRSFGWDTMDAFQQHDVQELNRILCDRLEERMKGTRVEGTINKLFEGHFTNYIECINIDYKSLRREAFQDLQLVVKGCNSIYDSFKEYCQVEILEGENKYEAEGHGKQDARRGVLFESLPPVLNLHLRRFEYDYERDLLVKINDKHEFYSEIDLDEKDENGTPCYLSSTADKTVRNKYKLLAVLVHSGGVHGGHYYAFIRPDGENWLKFDDERVEKASEAQAIQDNWGGLADSTKTGVGYPTQQMRMGRFSNAYMLVYVRESEWESIMCDVTEDDISEHIRARLRAEEQEKEMRRKERSEAHLFTRVRVARDADLEKQIGKSLFFDLVDFNSVDISLKLTKKTKFSEVLNILESKTGIKIENQRLRKFVSRQNRTFRPQKVLNIQEDSTISSLQDTKSIRPGEIATLDLYLEELPEKKEDHVPLQPTKTDMSIFVKQYFPDTKTSLPVVKYLGHIIAGKGDKINEICPRLRKMAGLSDDADIVLFEEVRSEPVMIEELPPEKTAMECELDDGDIIIVQEVYKGTLAKFPTAVSYLKDVKNRANIVLRPLSPSNEQEEKKATFTLDLKKDMTYDEISSAVSRHLGLDHSLKVQFTAQSSYTFQPRSQPIRYQPSLRLDAMCRPVTVANPNPVLYYEVIDLPLPEFERLVTHKISIHDTKHDEIASVTVTVPKDKTVGDLLEEVRKEAKDKVPEGAELRILEVYQWRIWQLFDPRLPVEQHLDSNPWHLRAEVIPEGQKDLEKEGNLHVHCLQVQEKDGNANQAFAFSDPFIMDISKTETVGELRKRVQEEMEIPDEEFSDWKIVLVAGLNMAMEPLAEDVIIADKLNPMDMSHARLYGHFDRAAIGFYHENKNPRRTHAHLNRQPASLGQDRALRIKA